MYVEGKDKRWMRQALLLAESAGNNGEVPVGAILVREDKVIALASNAMRHTNDPTAHAEMLVLRQVVSSNKNRYLDDVTLYVTLEPCLMCLGAIIHLHVGRVVFGAYDAKRGAAGTVLETMQLAQVEWHPEILGGVYHKQASQLLQDFFSCKRY